MVPGRSPTLTSVAARPALAFGDSRPRFSEGSAPDADPPIRSPHERKVLVTCPVDVARVPNGPDFYRLQCHLGP